MYLGNNSYESAQIRSNDLITYIIQIQSLLKSFNQSDKINFEEIVAELIKLRNLLRKKIDKDSQKFNVVRVFNQLDIISDSLNKLVGEIKTSIEKNN